MSKYTTELRYILEDLSDLEESKGYNSINEIISKAIELSKQIIKEVGDFNSKNQTHHQDK